MKINKTTKFYSQNAIKFMKQKYEKCIHTFYSAFFSLLLSNHLVNEENFQPNKKTESLKKHSSAFISLFYGIFILPAAASKNIYM